MAYVTSKKGETVAAFVTHCREKYGALPSVEDIRVHMGLQRRKSARQLIMTYRNEIGREVAEEILEADRAMPRMARRA
jgi:hypothetical protein